jgi:hypothetical protein
VKLQVEKGTLIMKNHSTLVLALGLSVMLLPFASGLAEMNSREEHSQHSSDHAATDGRQISMKDVFSDYFAIRASLAGDSLENVPTRAKALAESIERFSKRHMSEMSAKDEESLRTLMTEMATSATSLAATKDINSAREEFGKLSAKLAEYQKAFGAKDSEDVHVFACDMAKKIWLQESEDPENPYFGPAMAKCARKLQ